MRPGALLKRLGGDLEAVVLGDEHREDLAPPGEDRLQSGGFLVGDDARRRIHGTGEAGEDEGVYSVGFGESADGLGEVAGLARVDDCDGDSGGRDGGGGQTLVAAGGLEDDQFGGRVFEAREQLVDALLVVGESEGFAFRQKADVEGSLGNVDTDADRSLLGGIHCLASPLCWCGPGLADTGLLRKGAAAPATVRAPPKGGRDDSCFLAVSSEEHGPRSKRSVAPATVAL